MLKAELIYISKDNCSVCQHLLPKIKDMVSNYKLIELKDINIEKHPEIIQEYSIYSAPAVILKYDGHEIIREAGIISIDNLKDKIERFIELIS